MSTPIPYCVPRRCVVDDLRQDGEELVGQRRVAGLPLVGGGRDHEPQRGVRGVVGGVARRVREVVGHQPVPYEPRERPQDRRRSLGAAGDQRETGEGDERVAAPVVEPGVPGQHAGHGLTAGQATLHQELVRRQDQLADRGRRGEGTGPRQQVALALDLRPEGGHVRAARVHR